MMKKWIFNLCAAALLALIALPTHAQIRTPAASPGVEIKQTVGLTEITLNYSRPGMKGRTIFGEKGLVPFGEIWRTGANTATKISFGDDVKVGGQSLKKGDYAILTIPNAQEWTVNFYPYEGTNFGIYVEKTPAVSVKAKADALPFSVESFTMMIDNVTQNPASLDIYWDKTIVSVPVEVEVDKRVMADIERVLAGPNPNDYYNAASYYHDAGKDLNKALEWIQKATHTENPMFWQVRREALILADLGKKKEAVEAAKKSMELAEKAGNQDYVRMNKASIEEWSKN